MITLVGVTEYGYIHLFFFFLGWFEFDFLPVKISQHFRFPVLTVGPFCYRIITNYSLPFNNSCRGFSLNWSYDKNYGTEGVHFYLAFAWTFLARGSFVSFSTCPVGHCFFHYLWMHSRGLCWHTVLAYWKWFSVCYCLWPGSSHVRVDSVPQRNWSLLRTTTHLRCEIFVHKLRDRSNQFPPPVALSWLLIITTSL